MKIAVITSGFLPIPATKGGAVENLIVNLMNENEKNDNFKFYIFSIYDKDAMEQSEKYRNTEFKFIKVNKLIRIMDYITFWIAKNILKKENSHSYRFIFQRLSFLNKVSKTLQKENFDKVLLENHPSQYLALKWRSNYRKYDGKYYYHCHNEFPGTYGCNGIIHNTNKIICVSKFILNQTSVYMGMDKSKFTVLKNCIDKNKFQEVISHYNKQELLNKYKINDDEIILLFTGRIVPEKGIKELIQALYQVESKNYKLLILGAALNDIKEKTKFQIEIEELVKSIKDKIIFTGYVKYEEIAKFYDMADIAVLPSIWNDPAPLTIIESSVCELPIITTNSGGIPEYVNNKNAIIIERDENLITNIASAIDNLIEDKKRRKDMEFESARISKEATLDKFYESFIDVIK